jgi:hypothetical protein
LANTQRLAQDAEYFMLNRSGLSGLGFTDVGRGFTADAYLGYLSK